MKSDAWAHVVCVIAKKAKCDWCNYSGGFGLSRGHDHCYLEFEENDVTIRSSMVTREEYLSLVEAGLHSLRIPLAQPDAIDKIVERIEEMIQHLAGKCQ